MLLAFEFTRNTRGEGCKYVAVTRGMGRWKVRVCDLVWYCELSWVWGWLSAVVQVLVLGVAWLGLRLGLTADARPCVCLYMYVYVHMRACMYGSTNIDLYTRDCPFLMLHNTQTDVTGCIPYYHSFSQNYVLRPKTGREMNVTFHYPENWEKILSPIWGKTKKRKTKNANESYSTPTLKMIISYFPLP